MKINNMRICKEDGKIIAGTARWWTPISNICFGHGTRVSDLEELKLSELNDEDYIMITDASEKISKKIRVLTLKQFFSKLV